MFDPACSDFTWANPPVVYTIPDATVDIWRIGFDRPDSGEDTLSEMERERAARFARPEDRRRWSICRAALRWILSRYLSVNPESVEFEILEFGKPRIWRGPASSAPAIDFNLSHTRSTALIGITVDNEIGVDVEDIDRSLNPVELAVAVFSADETASVVLSAPADRLVRFLEIWTMKEAWLKMLGSGLVDNLKSYSILDPSALPPLLRPTHIIAVDPGSNLKAALCVRKPIQRVRTFQFRFDAA